MDNEGEGRRWERGREERKDGENEKEQSKDYRTQQNWGCGKMKYESEENLYNLIDYRDGKEEQK